MKFSVIGLAETNVGKIEIASLFKIDGYKSFYNDKIEEKSKGKGLLCMYMTHDTVSMISSKKLRIEKPISLYPNNIF